MELFIQIKDGQPYEHPIMGWNFYDAFPDIDPDNLPPNFARFERVDCNIEVGTYEVPFITYQWVGDIVKDVWSVRPMTDEERAEKDVWLAEVAAAEKAANAYADSLNSSGSAPNVIG